MKDPKRPKTSKIPKDGSAIDGMAQATEILGGLDPDHQKRLLSGIADKDPSLAEALLSRLFSFENPAELEDDALRSILNESKSETLALALRKAPEELKARINTVFPKRRAEEIFEQVQDMGPRKLSDVLEAQKQIVAIAKKLEAEGKIALVKRGSDAFV